MSMACPDHGWDIGELGCKPCDEKNGNPWARATGGVIRLSEAAKETNAAIMVMQQAYFAPIIGDPKDILKVIGSVV